jgi:hypothetical protein
MLDSTVEHSHHATRCLRFDDTSTNEYHNKHTLAQYKQCSSHAGLVAPCLHATTTNDKSSTTRVTLQTSLTHRPQKVPRTSRHGQVATAGANHFDSLYTSHTNHNHGTQSNSNRPDCQTHRWRRTSLPFAASWSRTRFQRRKVDGFLQSE